MQADVAAAAPAVPDLDYDALAQNLDKKSPLEIMDHVILSDRRFQIFTLLLVKNFKTVLPVDILRNHFRVRFFADIQALATFGTDVAIAFSGAEDVALVEYAHLTGRPFRVFR